MGCRAEDAEKWRARRDRRRGTGPRARALAAALVLAGLAPPVAALAQGDGSAGGAETDSAGDSAPDMAPGVAEALERITSELEAIHAVQQIHIQALRAIIAELEAPETRAARRAELAARIEVISAETARVCRLTAATESCAERGFTPDDEADDPAERARILDTLRTRAAEIATWR